jgi:hypothetical protein
MTTPPTAVSFTFGEQLLEQGNAVTITDTASDIRLQVGAAAVRGDTVSVAWPQGAGAGQFRAAFRVVSADGHPISGSITFTVAPSASGSPQPSAGAASAVPVASATASPTPASPVAVASRSTDRQGSITAAWVLGIGVVVLVGAVAILWSVRRRR